MITYLRTTRNAIFAMSCRLEKYKCTTMKRFINALEYELLQMKPNASTLRKREYEPKGEHEQPSVPPVTSNVRVRGSGIPHVPRTTPIY